MKDSKPGELTLTDPNVIACPYPTYHRLQTEAPVFLDPVSGYYEITRYEHVRAVSLDPATFSNRVSLHNSRSPALQAQIRQLYEVAGFPETPTLLNNDPPDHRRIRNLVDRAFTADRIRARQPAILAEVTRLLGPALARGHIEFIEEFALPLTLTVICDMVGVPPDDRPIIKLGSDAIIGATDPLTPDGEVLEMTRRVIQMQKVLADRIRWLRHRPDDSLLSVIASLENPRREDLSLLVHLALSVVVAGNETTMHALGNTMTILARDPILFERISRQPELARGFVEEALRIAPPGQGFYRVVTQDTEIAGTPIPKGAVVIVRRAAANVDESVFPASTEFQLNRPNINLHVGFGVGVHHCLGHLLARTELRIAIEEITQRARHVRLAEGPDAYVPTLSFLNSGVRQLKLILERADRPGTK